MFLNELTQREEEGRPIQVGIIGAGKFGGGLCTQISQMKGMRVALVADLDEEVARRGYTANGFETNSIRKTVTETEVCDAIRAGAPAITSDATLVCQSELIDVVVDTTGSPQAGAVLGISAISHGKHLIMVNVEADVCIGPYLRRLADEKGVVYSLVDGDQPGCIMNMVNWARALGFEIVAAGRGTIYQDGDFEGTPETVPERFGFSEEMMERRHVNLRMFNSFRDGTKAQTEMTALANAAGLVPDIRGMHEPSVNLEDIPKKFSLKTEGGLLSQHGVVELANSIEADGKTSLSNPLNMGVFVVIRAEHPHIQEDLVSYFVHAGGNGYNYLLYRPYHLVAVEAPMSIASAVFRGEATGLTLPNPTAELITVAKRDLSKGEMLDGGGGYTVNGLCEKADIARNQNLLPLAFASNVRLKQDINKLSPITYDMVEIDENSELLKLRRKQDALVWGE